LVLIRVQTEGKWQASILVARQPRRAKLAGIAAWQVIFVVGCAWFVFAMRDPNYQYIFVNDNLMRVRNAFFVLVGIWWIVALNGYRRVLLRKAPVLRAERQGSGPVIVVRTALPLLQSRKTMVIGASADVVFTEMPAMHFQGKGTYPRVVEVRSGGARLRNGAFWALDPESITEFVEQLREAGVAVSYRNVVSSQTSRRKSRRSRRR
jgi:hypothetical protein